MTRKLFQLKYLLTIPFFLFAGLILFYPLAYSFTLSFYFFKLLRPELGRIYIGLENYFSIIRDPYFTGSILKTVCFAVPAVTIEFLAGLGLALLLNKEIRGHRIFQSILLMPMMMSTVAIALIFRFMFHPSFGVINYLLGLGEFTWFSTSSMAMFSLILVDVYEWTPLTLLLLLAGLKSLPPEPFEAAKIDGASRIGVFRYLTIPMLKPVILITIIVRLVDAFKEYTKVYVLTQGGPGRATELVSFLIYRQGFAFFDMGLAAAMSYLFLVLVLALSLLLFMVQRQETYRK